MELEEKNEQIFSFMDVQVCNLFVLHSLWTTTMNWKIYIHIVLVAILGFDEVEYKIVFNNTNLLFEYQVRNEKKNYLNLSIKN